LSGYLAQSIYCCKPSILGFQISLMGFAILVCDCPKEFGNFSIHARAFTAVQSVRLPNAPRRRARFPIDQPARPGTSACWDFRGPAQPSPTLGDALNAGYLYLEVKCLGCETHQTVALNIVRRPKATPIHELERYMRCKGCSQVRGNQYKRSHLVALRPTKISAGDPPSIWWPGER
jgi:hypothetical protein